MRHSIKRLLVIALVLVTSAYAVAEEVILTTWYPAPRGVYEQLRIVGSFGFPGNLLELVTSADPVVFPVPESAARIGMRRTRGSATAPTPVANGDTLGEILVQGRAPNGTNFTSAKIQVLVDGAPAGGNVPSRIVFQTAAAGAAFAVERMRITSAGRVGIGTGAPVTNFVVFANTGNENQVNITDVAADWGLILGKNDAAEALASYHGPNWAHVVNFDNAPLVFGTSNTARMAINGAGSVGIGTTAPGARLDVIGLGGGNVDLRVNGRIQTGDAGGAGGVWLDNPASMFVGRAGANVGFWTNGAWRLNLTTDGRLGINQAPTAAVSPSNGVAAGNVDANDVWLRGANRWASQGTPSAMPVGQLDAGFWSGVMLGTGAQSITRFEWQNCVFENCTSGPNCTLDDIFGTPGPGQYLWLKSGTGSCHSRRFNVPGDCNPDVGGVQTCTRWVVFAACPTAPADNWKVISGGVNFYPAHNDERPGDGYINTPDTWTSYNAIPVGAAQRDTGAPVSGATEGWTVATKNTGGYDGVQAYALCGSP